MQEKAMKISELANIVKINMVTLKDYLSNYRFIKYTTHINESNHKKLAFEVCENFAKDMALILYLRRKKQAVKLWGDYCGRNYLTILDKEYKNA